MSIAIVKVQVPLTTNHDSPLPLVYDRARQRMSMQPVSHSVLAELGDDPKGYFEAEWVDDRWVIGRRVADQSF